MFYWNARKTAYVTRGSRGKCPCQNESDDSVPGRVRCDAMVHWHEPARFRTICPLLVSTPDGWRCSVHASQVRPFWGRVIRWCAGGTLIVYLLGALAIFAGFRILRGVPVSYVQVAWPGRWHQVREVQANFLFKRAIDAFAHGRLGEAYLALTSAQARDPQNYDSALMLAQIAMFQGSYMSADAQFERLLREHSENGARTAIAYHDTLLSVDQMARLAEFSLAMAKQDAARAPVWVRSALLAVKSLSAADVRALDTKLQPLIAPLPPQAQTLLRAEFAVRAGDGARAVESLRARMPANTNPFYLRYQAQRLAELGAPRDAQVLLDFYGPMLGEFEQQLGQYELARTARDEVGAAVALRRLLRLPLNEQRVERLAASLVTRPDAASYRAFAARVQRDPLLEAVSDGAALWAAGIAGGVPAEAAYWQSHGRQPPMSGYPAIQRFDFSTRDLGRADSIPHLLNVVTLPREVLVALLARVTPQEAVVPRAHRAE